MGLDNFNCFLCCSSNSENEAFRTSAKSLVESNLDVVFLLRNLLQVPRIQLERQLKKSGDSPENWMRFCSKCTQLTRYARKLDQKIKKIEIQVLQLIKTSTLPNHKQGKEDCANIVFQENIRSFVKNSKRFFFVFPTFLININFFCSLT